MAQRRQRSTMLDFTQSRSNADKLKEKYMVEEREEANWSRVQKAFGTYQDKGQGPKKLRVQPQLGKNNRFAIEGSDGSHRAMEHWIPSQLEGPHLDDQRRGIYPLVSIRAGNREGDNLPLDKAIVKAG